MMGLELSNFKQEKNYWSRLEAFLKSSLAMIDAMCL